MSLAAREFQEIKAEVDIYFAYLERIDRDEARLEQRTGDASVQEPFAREFKTILKANALILLYHLVEATVQRSVDGIIDAVRLENVGYAEASANVRKIWGALRVRQMRRASEDTWVQHVTELAEKCIQHEALSLNGREIVKGHAGNIDAQTIRNLAEEFGFEVKSRPEAKGGDDLERIRHSRNLLAHGVQRFTQVGAEMTVAELLEMKDRVAYFLEDLIACADGYVQAKSFRCA